MDSVSKTFSCICRLCLKLYEFDQMSPLVTDDNELSSYGNIVKNIANITVKLDDKLPKNLCVGCKKELDKILSFKSMCETNNQSLLLIVNNDYKNASLDEKKEMICTYAMYRHYLPEACGDTSENDLKDTFDLSSSDSEDIICDFSPSDDIINVNDSSIKSENEQNEDPTENVDELLSNMEKLYSSKLNQAQKKIFKPTKVKIKRNIKKPNDFICPICNKKLANAATFQGHMNTHDPCVICDQCGKALSTKSALFTHLVAKHNTPSGYECDYCGFQAPRRHELIEHIRLHTGERPFTCETCGLTFRRQAIWKFHLKCHSEKSIQCTLCPRKFCRTNDLKLHMNNVHDRMYLYICKICHASYARTGTVRKHMTAKHGVPREAQGKITRVTKATHRSLFQGKNSLDDD